jgi:hypothetical protein
MTKNLLFDVVHEKEFGAVLAGGAVVILGL